ncbi:MAG: TonB-dependent receptor domain-containing protein [Terriglobia bacterium]
MLRLSGRFALALALVFGFFVGTVWAQGGGSGELTGIVYDPTGAVVPRAQVTLTNTATGIIRTTETSEAGLYRFVALPVVGTYTLRVEVQGFKTAEVTDIIISVGRVVTRDVTLEVGAAVETVTVEAGVQLVQPTESQVSEVVDRRVWESMPLENRSQNTFINLLAGVVPSAFNGSTRGAAVSGARGGTGNFLVEGYDNNDQGQGGRGALIDGAITSISPEAIEEYRVISHAYSAEYGKGGGFVTDTVLKSGTNELHGSVFLYNRVQKLAANSFFSNRDGLEDSLIRNQFGGSLGGPVIKDKTFVYGSVEIHRRRRKDPLTTVGTTQQFIDFIDSGAFASFMETTFGLAPGALANSASLGPIARAEIAKDFPLATSNFSNLLQGLFTGGLGLPVPVFGDVALQSEDNLNENRFTIKVDHQAGAKDSFSGSFMFEDSDITDAIGGGVGNNVPFLAPGRSINVGFTQTHTFTPTVINQFRMSYLRHRRDFPNPPGFEATPAVISAFDPLGIGFGSSNALPQFFTDNQFQYQDHLSWTFGRHNFKAGGEYRRTRNGSAFEAEKNGLFLPYGVEDMLTDGFFTDDLEQALFGGSVFGSYFLAEASVDPTRGGLSPIFYRGYRVNEMAGYIQDDIRVTARLSLNVGLRYEYFGIPHNFRKGLDSNFFFGNAITPIPNRTGNIFFPVGATWAARESGGGFQQRDNGIWNKDTNNFAPRLGFSYDVLGTQKVIIRGGGGVFYDRMWNNLFENIRFNQPFFCFCGFGAFINGIPAGPIASPGIYNSPFGDPERLAIFANTGVSGSARHMDQDLVSAYWQQYYLGVQWQFQPDFALELNYVSTLGRKLQGIIDLNTFNGRTASGQPSGRINPNLTGDNFRTNAFKSNYHGLQATVRKRYSFGLQLNANYTWSHAIDELSDAFENDTGLRPFDNFDISLSRGNADYDIRHRFVTSYYYDLPLFKDNALAGGWSISGIVTAQVGRGFPLFNSTSAGDANEDVYRTDTLTFIGSGDPDDAVTGGQSPADGYFDTSQFVTTACLPSENFGLWCNGRLGRNTVIGPGFANVDFSIAKRFRIKERATVEFQANFFNIFNRANFLLPSGNIVSSQFGRSVNTFDPRITQLVLRVDF